MKFNVLKEKNSWTVRLTSVVYYHYLKIASAVFAFSSMVKKPWLT